MLKIDIIKYGIEWFVCVKNRYSGFDKAFEAVLIKKIHKKISLEKIIKFIIIWIHLIIL